jgi:hypothetical protein
MTFLSSFVIGRGAAAECGVVAAVAIGFPSIDLPGLIRVLGRKPECRALSRGIVTAPRSQESIEREATAGLSFHNSQLVFATSV